MLHLLRVGIAGSGGARTVADNSQLAVGVVLHLGRVGGLTKTRRTSFNERRIYQYFGLSRVEKFLLIPSTHDRLLRHVRFNAFTCVSVGSVGL